MRTTRITRIIALVALLVLGLAACGGTDDGTGAGAGDSPTAEETSPTSEDTAPGQTSPTDGETGDLSLVNEGTLTVCSDIPYPPFEMEAEEGGGFTGFDIDLITAIADQLGLSTEVIVTGFEGIQSGAALAADQCDVAASAMTITEEREENLDFSEPYYNAQQSLLVPADSDIQTLEDTAGMTIGVQSETTGAQYARENAPDDAEIVEFPGAQDLFNALDGGQIDAILQDLPVNLERAEQDDSLEVVEQYDTGEQYGFAVAEEGSENLLEAINQALSTLREDGTYDEIFQEYFPGAEQ